MTNWATTDDVLNVTGQTVTDAQITRAQFFVEVFADVSPESHFNEDGNPSGVVSSKNVRYLMLATAYQTVWMEEHPDVFTNLDVRDLSEDGVSISMNGAQAGILAPMAWRCIKRLTWMRPNRSLRVKKRLNPEYQPYFGSRDSVMADEERPWSPL